MNLGEIRTLMSDILNRDDMTDAQADQWITMALRRIQRWVRIPSQEVEQLYTVGETHIGFAIPSDYIMTKAFYLDADGAGPLDTISLQEYIRRKATTGTSASIPTSYTREGSYMQVYPVPTEGQVFKLIYWAEHEDMLVDTDENLLARVAPDLIIYTALIYAGNFYVDERAEQWKQMAGEFVAELENQAEIAEASGLNMRVQPMYGNETGAFY